MSEVALIEYLEEMEGAAKDLQIRLVDRDTDGIWDALEKQEQAMENLSKFSVENLQEMEGVSGRNKQVRNLLTRSQSLLRTNRALSQTFLHVIDRTLGHLSGSDGAVYAGQGSSVVGSRPLIISQQG